MIKRACLYLIIILLILGASISSTAIRYKESNALKLHVDSVIVDTHNDAMSKIVDENTWLPVTDIRYNTNNHIDIPKMRAGNLKVGFFAAYTSAYHGNSNRALSRTLALLNALYWTEDNNRDIFTITKSYEEIERAILDWKIAAVPSIEGAYAISNKNGIELLRQFNDLGVKAIGFTWNYSNELGEGAYEVYVDKNGKPSTGGLTKLGEDIIGEMNRLGILVDVSHLNVDTFWDVINITKAPIIASHSGVYTIKPHQRNLNDDQLKAIAENGGVVGMVLYRGFVKGMDNTYIKDFVDHIDYAVKLIGIDHVGLGSDFDGGEIPLDMADVSEMYKITEELVHRGYSEEDIKKILGRNTLRVIKEAEALAEKPKSAKDVVITPYIEMGEIVTKSMPKLSAKVEGLNINKLRIIVDGIAYDPIYDEKDSIVSLQLKDKLIEKFHVVTFEATDDEGAIKRETRIFCFCHPERSRGRFAFDYALSK